MSKPASFASRTPSPLAGEGRGEGRLITLDAWRALKYGASGPPIGTIRRWAAAGKIHPVPEKQGRAYYVREDARYIDPSKPLPKPTLLETIRATEATRQRPS